MYDLRFTICEWVARATRPLCSATRRTAPVAALLLTACTSVAQVRSVSADTNGLIVAPTNFWPANSNALNAVIGPAGLSGAGGVDTAGNGLVKSGSTLHVGQSASYLSSRIPFTTGTNTIGFDIGLQWNNSSKDLELHSGGFGTTIRLESASGSATFSGIGLVTAVGGAFSSSLTRNGYNVSSVSINATNVPVLNLQDTSEIAFGLLATNASATVVALDAAKLTSGTMATARLGSGTANSTTFLSGDQTYKQVADAQVSSSAAIGWTKIDKTGSSLADLATRSASDLTSGTVSTNRLPTLVKDLGNITPTTGDLFFYDGSNLQRLPAGTSGFVLTANGAGVAPSYAAASGGAGVTNVFVTVEIETNNFTVGKGGHLTVNNTLTLLPAGPNKILRTDSNTNVVAATIGTGLTFDGTTLAASGGGGGGASTWVPNTALTYSGGTNVTMDASGGTNFTVTVTNTTFMTAPNNPPGSTSTNTSWTVTFKMDATGGYAVTWTNLFKGAQFQPLTNANAVSMVTITTSPLTNGQYFLDYGLFGLQ